LVFAVPLTEAQKITTPSGKAEALGLAPRAAEEEEDEVELIVKPQQQNDVM